MALLGEPLNALADDWYSFGFQGPLVSAGGVFSDNGAAQSVDLQLDPTAPCYENGKFVSLNECGYSADPDSELNYADSKALYFVNSLGWATPTVYIWNVTPAGSVPNSNWPGVALESVGAKDLFFIELGDDTEQGKVIFINSGAN